MRRRSRSSPSRRYGSRRGQTAVEYILLMGVVVAFSCLLIIGSDNLLRQVYTSVGFIPSQEDVANYASRFDGLDLPSGWMNNMNEQDVAKLAEQLNVPPPSSNLPSL